jgi:hypothetical protein
MNQLQTESVLFPTYNLSELKAELNPKMFWFGIQGLLPLALAYLS